MTREKWSILAVALIAVAMIVGGCTRSDEHKAANRPSATATTPLATPTPTATSTSSKGPGPITCQPSQLKVKLAEDHGGGAAGSTYSHLAFTNIGALTCTMTGWPGVS